MVGVVEGVLVAVVVVVVMLVSVPGIVDVVVEVIVLVVLVFVALVSVPGRVVVDDDVLVKEVLVAVIEVVEKVEDVVNILLKLQLGVFESSNLPAGSPRSSKRRHFVILFLFTER